MEDHSERMMRRKGCDEDAMKRRRTRRIVGEKE